MGNPKFTRRATLAGMMGGVAGFTDRAAAPGVGLGAADRVGIRWRVDAGIRHRASFPAVAPGPGLDAAGAGRGRSALRRPGPPSLHASSPRAGADCAWRTLHPDRGRRRNAREASRGRVPRRLSRRRADDGALSQRRQAADRDRQVVDRLAHASRPPARRLDLRGLVASGPPRLGAARDARFSAAQLHGHERLRLRQRHADGGGVAARCRTRRRPC